MANLAAKVTAAYFDANGLRYQMLGDDEEVLRAGFAMQNREGAEVLMIFDNGEGVALKMYNYVKFPDQKRAEMYKICNELNAQYRWIKFYVDEKDNTITAEDDMVIQLDSCAEEVFRGCLQLVKIADDAYPKFMKAIFG